MNSVAAVCGRRWNSRFPSSSLEMLRKLSCGPELEKLIISCRGFTDILWLVCEGTRERTQRWVLLENRFSRQRVFPPEYLVQYSYARLIRQGFYVFPLLM